MPKRIAITGPDQVELLDYDDPPLDANQVLVTTELASGKHGTTTGMLDNRTYAGQNFDQTMRLFVPDEMADEARRPTRENPWRFGTSGLGTVAAVGADVTRVQPGDRVFGLMDLRETNICPEDRVWHLGDIDPYLALCVEPAYVSIHCAREGGIALGENVLIGGLGALGLIAVEMARYAGADQIIALDPLPKRRELAQQYGADHTLDPFDGDAALKVHELTDNAGVDVAIELSGVYPALATAIRSTRIGGTVCSAGFYQGEAHGLFLGREWHHNRLTIVVPHGCGWGHHPREYPRWNEGRAYDSIVNMMRAGRLTVPGLINLTVSVNEVEGILDQIRDNPNDVIKFAVDFTRN
jgi:threonine dehydrogenase-like Zn-dependent dehydrogenase